MEATLKDWLGSVWKVMIFPFPRTFINEAQKAKGKTASAIVALLLLTIIVNLFNYVVLDHVFSPITILAALILAPIQTFFLAFWLDTICRKLFHFNTSYYDEYLYLAVVVAIVTQTLYTILNLIPFLQGNYLLAAWYLYPILLLTIAVQSLTKVKIWQATVIVVLSTIFALIGFACVAIFLLMMTRGMPGIY